MNKRKAEEIKLSLLSGISAPKALIVSNRLEAFRRSKKNVKSD